MGFCNRDQEESRYITVRHTGPISDSLEGVSAYATDRGMVRINDIQGPLPGLLGNRTESDVPAVKCPDDEIVTKFCPYKSSVNYWYLQFSDEEMVQNLLNGACGAYLFNCFKEHLKTQCSIDETQ